MDPRFITDETLEAIRHTALAETSSGARVVLRLLDHIELLSEAVVQLGAQVEGMEELMREVPKVD